MLGPSLLLFSSDNLASNGLKALQLPLNIVMELFHGGGPEKLVNLLQSETLSLLHEEEGKDTHTRTHAGKDNEGLPADVMDDLRGDTGDHKVEQPLGRSCEGHAVRADMGREDLSGVDPWT